MKKSVFWKLLAVVMVAGFVLAACGGNVPATTAPSSGGNAPTAAPSGGNSPTAAPSSGGAAPKVTSSGFVCPEPNPKVNVTSTQLNLFVWTEYIPTDIQECFQLVYGVTVNRDEYSSNEEMYAKLSAGATSYDIVQPTNNFVSLMIHNNMIQKLDKSKLSIMGNFDPSYLGLPYDPNNDYTVPYEAGTDAIVYNADKIKTPPTSWSDLWKNGCLSKNMIMLDGAHDIIGAVLAGLGYDVNTKDPQQLDQAKAVLLKLAPCIKSYDSDSPKTSLIAGDVDLGIIWTGDAFLAQQEVPSIKYVYPTEGAILWQDNYAIPTNAPHLDAAYAWLNYSMQANMFWMMLRDFPYTNPNKAALDYAKGNQMAVTDSNGNQTTLGAIYDAYINSPITNTPPDAIKAGHWLEDLGDASPLYDKIWTEVKGK